MAQDRLRIDIKSRRFIAVYAPGHVLGRDGASFQEVTLNAAKSAVAAKHGRYCTIRGQEKAPPTSKPPRYWMQIYRTPDNTE